MSPGAPVPAGPSPASRPAVLRPPRGSARSLAEAGPARSPPPAANYPPCWLRARRRARQRRGRQAGGGGREGGEPGAPAPAEPRPRRRDKGGRGAALQMEMNPESAAGSAAACPQRPHDFSATTPYPAPGRGIQPPHPPPWHPGASRFSSRSAERLESAGARRATCPAPQLPKPRHRVVLRTRALQASPKAQTGSKPFPGRAQLGAWGEGGNSHCRASPP